MCEEKEALAQKILRVQQEINTVGHNYPLLYVHRAFVDKMERDNSGKFTSYLDAMDILAEKCLRDYEDYGAFINLKDTFSEALVLSVLSAMMDIQKVTEGSSKSPDFRVNHMGNTIYVEMKSLNMAEGTLKHKDIMESAFESKIELERQIEKQWKVKHVGNIVASVVTVHKPYYSANKPYDEYSAKLVIETLIDKIRQNIKEEQFGLGDTILLLNFSDQLRLAESPSESLQEDYIAEFTDNSRIFDHLEHRGEQMSLDEHKKFWNSMEAVGMQNVLRYPAKGCLWHVAFGQVGTVLTPGAEVLEILDKEGILREFEFIKGVLFFIDGKLYACMKNVEPTSIFELFSYLSQMNFIEEFCCMVP